MTRGIFRLSLLAMLISTVLALLPSDDFETVRSSNAAILNRLGLISLPDPDLSNHHRKRLAPSDKNSFAARVHPSSYGRRHNTNSHDSHVYVVKLPSSPPYYSFSKPHKDKENVTLAKTDPGFKNNGKPAKIYHWNLPLVKKINEKKKQMALLKLEQARKKLEAERERQKVTEKMNYLKKLAQEQLVGESVRKPSRNNDKWLSEPENIEARTKNSEGATQMKILNLKNTPSANKIYRLDDSQERSNNWHNHHHHHHNNNNNDLPGQNNTKDEKQRSKKHKKKSAGVSYYYAPVSTSYGKSSAVSSTNISKHFSGNGKPKAFYVMEKSRKPAYYHPLLP